jgi:hypothetical protein
LLRAIVHVNLFFNGGGFTWSKRVWNDKLNKLHWSLIVHCARYCGHGHVVRADINNIVRKAQVFDAHLIIAHFELESAKLFLELQVDLSRNINKIPLENFARFFGRNGTVNLGR